MLSFRLLFYKETIDIWADTHCQNCISGRDITLKTTQSFFKSYCELHLSFFLDVRSWLLFNQKAIGMQANAHCQNFSGKDITLKTTQHSLKFIWITSNIMKHLFESQYSSTRKFSSTDSYLTSFSNVHVRTG